MPVIVLMWASIVVCLKMVSIIMSLIKMGIGSFIAIALLGCISKLNILDEYASLFLIGSFGATAVMIFSIPTSPLAQAKNVIGGHLISSIVGVTVHLILSDLIIIAAALAVSLSIVLMQITETLHPPGGATALIAVVGGPAIYQLGYHYVLSPVLLGTLLMLFVAKLLKLIVVN